MIKGQLLYRWGCLALLLPLFGCDPFDSQQDRVAAFIDDAQQKEMIDSRQTAQSQTAQLRNIKPYKPYRYKTQLRDPFQDRLSIDNTAVSQQNNIEQTQTTVCLPPQCVAPEAHAKSLLEEYDLARLVFVGTMSGSRKIALIRTPDHGTVQVKIGDYMGKDNGRVVDIQDYSLVLQEKIYHNGLWQNKKTVLTIQ
ncbi:MAG: hypothetical protein CSA44_00500 [Gammaproteobacteria bacterium]|nr:MAG: hypothetical protein CSA44_00500 [Gammaproteobacteria bacterium]